MDYQYLTAEDQAAVVAEVRAAVPDPTAGQRDREREHFRATLLAEAGVGERPDPLGPDESPDVKRRAEFHAALDAAVAALPADVQAVLAADVVADVAVEPVMGVKVG